MYAFVTLIFFGVLVSIVGVLNMKGNVSSLHWYHRRRVTEENRKPFGMLIGLGTVIIGASLVLLGAALFAFERTQRKVFLIVGISEMIFAITVGLTLSFYAMIKYNKGIF